MAVKNPNADLPRGIRATSRAWDLNFSEQLLEVDYFPTATPTGIPMLVRIAGSFVTVTAMKVKVAGTFTDAAKKVKIGGVFA